MTVVTMLFAVSAVFAGETPQAVMHFANWIPQLEFDSTNDCYVARYDPSAHQHAYVHTSKSKEPLKIQPGEYYAITRGEKAHFTQYARVGCTLTYTNEIPELNGIALPGEFRGSSRLLLVDGRFASKNARGVFCEYAFAVNADGEAFDVGTRKKFDFGLPFHASKDKTPPRLSRSIENIQRKFREEGVEACETAANSPKVQAMNDSMNGNVTNAVAFVWDVGGAGNLSEADKKSLVQLDPENAPGILGKMEASRRQDACVAFCTKEKDALRILAVARAVSGNEWRFWTYSRDGAPEFVFIGDGHGVSENYYEYGEDRLFRNFCLISKSHMDYRTLKDGALQRSSDAQKAHEFVSKVEEMFYRYVELDTTGTFKPFVEKLRSQAGDKKLQQEAK